METNQIKLSLPAHLHQQLKNLAAKNQKNVEEFLLEIINREMEASQDKATAYNKDAEEKVKERLKNLGHMD